MNRGSIALGEYYRCRRRVVRVGGQSLTVLRRPALGRPTETLAASRLLAVHPHVEDGADVLVLHAGDGLVAAAVAMRAPTARFTAADTSAAAAASTRRTLAANGVQDAEVVLSDCAQAVLDRRFDTVLALLPKGRAPWEQTVRDAAAVLRPGGAFYLAGARNCGVRTAGRFMAKVFGEVEVVAYKAGSRLLRSVRPQRLSLPPSDYYQWHELTADVAGQTLRVQTRAGLFSRDALDEGTRMLIESLAAEPPQRIGRRDRVLDLGCGCGVLTLFAARRAPRGRVVGVDVDCRAVEATRRTLEADGLSHAEAVLSDCVEAIADRRLDVVVTNPPMHQGKRAAFNVPEQFIRDAARVLKADGRLFLVAHRFLKYGRTMRETFGDVRVLREDSKFRVWCAERPKPHNLPARSGTAHPRRRAGRRIPGRARRTRRPPRR